MTYLVDLMPFILPWVHDCSEPAAMTAARLATREFCKTSLWLQYEPDPILVQAGVADYEIETPADTIVAQIIEAQLDGEPITLKGQTELRQMWGGKWRAQEGVPKYLTQLTADTLRLVPSPEEDATDGLTLLLALQPSLDAQEIDDNLFNHWGEQIGFGARAKLKEMPGQPYYDPPGALVLWGKFIAATNSAKLQRQRDMNAPVQSVQLRAW